MKGMVGYETKENKIQTKYNKPLPSSKNPNFQNKAKCTTFLVNMSFICMQMKNHFQMKG